ncbi:MAG: hypothetical protein JW910_12800, partial [Anaerolineae bacterium]|nr:hypothetical protein [Anaerolineae bacterium]
MFRPVRRFLSRIFGPLLAQLRRTPVLAFQIGLLVSILLEKLIGEQFAELLEFRRIPKFFGVVDIFEPFSNLDFSGILAPFFPPPNVVVEAPLQDSGNAIVQLLNDFFQAFLYHGSRDPGFVSVVVRVLAYDMVVFVIPTLVIAFLLRTLLLRVLPAIPRWVNIAVHLVALYGIVVLWGADGGTRELVLIFMGINIMLSVSLNLVNGYMGE